jgi:glycosyltransferase involved in cell wall biosynthesis/Tfp pilus assembly protein PilF
MSEASDVQRPGFAVLTLYTPEIADWAEPVAQRKREYCDRHGYEFACAFESLDNSRHPVWSKLLLIERHLSSQPGCTWAFWTDADSVIMNPSLRLEDFVDDHDLIISEDHNGLNAGVFFLRNGDRSLSFLRRAYGMREFLASAGREQAAMADLLRTGAHGLKVKRVPQKLFNAYRANYCPGDFMLHFAGMKDKAALITAALRAGPDGKPFPTISGVILARNEEHNIVDCINALRPHVSEIVLIDMESSDRTVDLARPLADKVLAHPLVTRFDAARNIAIPTASNDWLWFVDADERIPARTGDLVNDLIRREGDQIASIMIPFKTYFCGQWMEHCGWWPGYCMARVLKRGHFEFNARLHGGVRCDGRQVVVAPDPRLGIEHFSYRSVEHYISKFNAYTSTEALQLSQDGSHWDWQIATREMVRDLWTYYERNDGALDGARGWILSWLSGQYRWLSHAKLIDHAPQGPESARSPSIPESLDSVLALMADTLTALRADRPVPPLGIVWRSFTWDSSGYADDSRTLVKALACGSRPLLVVPTQENDGKRPFPEAEVGLFKSLCNAKRPRYFAAIWNAIAPTATRDPLAAVNILRTMFETDRIPDFWVPHLEQFDEVWVLSKHSARAFRRSGVPPERIRIVPSCVDTAVYSPAGDRFPLPASLHDRFVFLSVFDWHPRKGWDLLLRAYCREFKTDEGVGLLMKVTRQHGHSPETVMQQAAQAVASEGQSLAERPDIIIWEKDLSQAEMAALYRSAGAFVLPTRGEGWGRPFMEAMACGLPVIGTAQTGNAEFMDNENSFIVPAREAPASLEAIREVPRYGRHRWIEPSFPELRAQMRMAAGDEKIRQSKAQRALTDVQSRFNLRAGREGIERALDEIENRFLPVVLPDARPEQARVVIEGEFFAGHSFSQVNEQLSLQLMRDPGLALAVDRVQGQPTCGRDVPHAYLIVPAFQRKFKNGPEVTIRHCYPPHWEKPRQGKWVHIQPWEFGFLPVDWVAPLRDNVDEIWIPSEYVRKVYERSGIPAEKIHVISWGVDPQVFNPEAPPRFLPTRKSFAFLFVGGAIVRKGIDRLLAAYLAEFSRDEDVCLIVKDMGTNSFYRDGYRDRILQASNDDRNPEIIYSEARLTTGQLASLYTACQCLALPYRGEGFGLPILEAMACGVPAIVPRGGPSDDFASDDTAFLLPTDEAQCEHPLPLCGPPTDLAVKVEDIRIAMRLAFERREDTRQMGQRASRAVAHLTWAETARRMSARLHALTGRDRDSSIVSAETTSGGDRDTIAPAVKHPTLSLCMIVRDNAGTLDAAITSIKPWVDEMIVVDTGSLDDTPAIAKKHGARVYHFPWCDDFSAARNESLRHAMGEWIFWMDSDDVIDAACGQKLRAIADQPLASSPMAYVMQVYCPGAQDGANLTIVDHVKMFRNRLELRFDHRIHEQILPAIRRAGGEVAWTDVFVRHAGADISPEGRARKHARDLRLLQMELAERPDHPFTLFNLGMTYADMRDYERAADYLGRSILISPPGDSHVRKAFALLVSSLTESGRIPAAWETCERGLSIFPKDAELLFRRGILAHRCGRLEDAKLAYLAALSSGEERHFSSLDPGIRGFKARHNLAIVYADMGRFAEAEIEWRRVVHEAPEFTPGWRGLGETLIRQRKYQQAATESSRLLSHRRFRLEGLMLQAEVAKAEGNSEESLHLLEQAISEFSEEAEPLRRICQVLFESGDPSRAEVVLRKLVQREPGDASARHNLGTMLLQLNRLEDAEAEYRTSLELRPNSPATHQNLGYVLRGLGRTDEANAAFAEAVRLSHRQGEAGPAYPRPNSGEAQG